MVFGGGRPDVFSGVASGSSGADMRTCALTEMGEYESAALAFFEGMQIDGDNKDLKRGFDAAIARGREAHLKETGKK